MELGTPFYVIFIIVFALLAFGAGSAVAFMAMSAKIDPTDEEQPAA